MKSKRGRPAGTFKNPVRKTAAVYQRWVGMTQRCYNPNSHIWKYYGGRGVAVCARWLGLEGFRNFYADMGEPNGLTLDRFPDRNGNYEPGNCRWATMAQQAANRNAAAVNPESLWGKAKLAGLPYHVVYQRVKLLGWDEARALSVPVSARTDRIGRRRVAA